ncbi:hypothetical protein ISF_05985 [Cordyceps fumosorosea ARSEF 2679]|uniref:Uncharacterized protein n=1 Tax=Cordyceps fumosorosea (strain ARSEF 2679) TaxID=1081104 RepID=A0A167SVS0_CORFA|nr:hypothetical protein ISF_05985 [Cordyceps fumosorosea ARSEF 2679]OAA59974.1 hypothetical protein ISF_05985 [Cordyceps fumosorosea ARSEF 2679]
MPDIEKYEPTDAELAGALVSDGASFDERGLSTEEAAAADMEAQKDSVAHGDYDALASEDDIMFETFPSELRFKRRPFNHELLTHQHLGVSALGRPVEALILKDPNRMQRSRKQIPVLEPEVQDAAPVVELKWTDYVAKTDDEQDPVLEAWDNIDEMRPIETNTMPAHEYHRLVATLVDGFTQGQLSSYITMKHAQELESQATETSQLYPWIQKQTPWQAGYQIELESKKPKYVCAATIIDKIWKLEVREQVESLGRALLWVHPVTFKLLTGHGRPVLEAIQREMLNPGNNERLAAKSEESRLGIYAAKAAIPPIIERLNEVAKAVTSTQLSTEYINKENLTQPILDALASITNTIIETSSSGKELTVHWVADDERPSPTTANVNTTIAAEGPADIVWRLLMAAQWVPEANATLSSKMVTRAGRGKKPKGGLYMDYHREERSRSWRDKLRSWTRYGAAVTKAEETTLPPLQLATRVELADLPSLHELGADNVLDVTFATFGHVLHPKATVKSSGKKVADKKSADNGRRILSPVIPHPAALTTLSAIDEAVTQSTAIVLHFAPDTTRRDSGTSAGDTLPRVRLTLPVDETTDLSRFEAPSRSSTLQAVTAHRIQDLLLPGEAVDVRLTQQRLVTLGADQPAMRRFLDASEFNLLEGRLRTPSRVSALTVPTDAGTTDASYLFVGLEVRQAVETRLGRHTVRYESVEAGQHGGQRQELSLHRAAPDAANAAADDGFLQLVEDVAAGHVFSWNDGAALMQRRSSETFTMDLLDDGALDDERRPAEPAAEEEEGAQPPQEDGAEVRAEEGVADAGVPAQDGDGHINVTESSAGVSSSSPQTKATAHSQQMPPTVEATTGEPEPVMPAAMQEPKSGESFAPAEAMSETKL